MKSPKDLFLMLASMCFIIVLGAAVYEHIAVVPQWSVAPPKSLSMYQGEYGLQAEYFWMTFHPVTLLLMIGALITNWKTARRGNILIVLTGYVVILTITAIYFVPALIDITGTPFRDTVDSALVQRASIWETLSLFRLAFIVFLSLMLLSALAKPMVASAILTATTPQMIYPNDALGG